MSAGTVASDPTPDGYEEAPVFQVVPTLLLGLLVILAMPVWRWSRGWGWAPAGMLAMGLGSLVLFSFAVEPA